MEHLLHLALAAGAAAALGAPAFAEDAPALTPLKVAKECSQYSGNVPSFCTITESDFAAIPKGTKVLYYGPVANNPHFSTNTVVLDTGTGTTAAGNCIVDFGAGPHGICAFYAGSGDLAGFMAIVQVSVDAGGIWHWEGGYSLNPM